jgi:plastocyanin
VSAISRHCLLLASFAILSSVVSTSHAMAPGAVSGRVHRHGQPQKDAVIWLDGVTEAGRPEISRAVMDQRNLAFSPRVLAVRVGMSVRMPNNDRVFHNVFSFKDGKRFDLGLYPVGQSRSVTFDKPGVSRVFCNIHPNMAAYIVTVNSSHYAVADERGQFTMAAVPPGVYTYHVWRPGSEPLSGEVHILADNRVELALP